MAVNTQLVTTTNLLLQTERAAIELVTNSLTSDHSKRAYSKALFDFFKWREANNNSPLTKATVLLPTIRKGQVAFRRNHARRDKARLALVNVRGW